MHPFCTSSLNQLSESAAWITLQPDNPASVSITRILAEEGMGYDVDSTFQPRRGARPVKEDFSPQSASTIRTAGFVWGPTQELTNSRAVPPEFFIDVRRNNGNGAKTIAISGSINGKPILLALSITRGKTAHAVTELLTVLASKAPAMFDDSVTWVVSGGEVIFFAAQPHKSRFPFQGLWSAMQDHVNVSSLLRCSLRLLRRFKSKTDLEVDQHNHAVSLRDSIALQLVFLTQNFFL